jgi:hypothetical protein
VTGRGPHMYLSIQQPRKVVEDGVLLGKREAGKWSVTGHCSAVEDGVLLGKRESRERSVTESLSLPEGECSLSGRNHHLIWVPIISGRCLVTG